METILRFPAASALIGIGRPAVPDLLRVIEGTSTELERQLATLALLQIERIPSDDFETPDDPAAKERLASLFERRKRAAGPNAAEAYDRMLRWLEDYRERRKAPTDIPGFLTE